jgi:hypothetical protein
MKWSAVDFGGVVSEVKSIPNLLVNDNWTI